MIAANRIRTRSLGMLTGLLAIVCLAFGASPASAMQQINMFDATVFDDAGDPVTNAGRHPNTSRTKFLAEPYFPTGHPDWPWARERPNDVIADLPPGFVGNPLATTNCSIAGQVNSIFGESCPVESQVGYAALFNGIPSEAVIGTSNPSEALPAGIANLGPASGTPAVLGINYVGVLVYSTASVRSGDDYGLTISTKNLPVALNLHGVSYNVWGNPQDPAHDGERGFFCAAFGFECLPSSAPNVPFLSLPTSCGAPPVTKLAMDSWDNPNEFVYGSVLAHDDTAPIPNPTGNDACNALEFSPTLEARPTTTAGDSPSGLDVDLHIPQNEDPHGTATAHLKDSTVTLPEGLVVNPSSANGLGTCSLSDMGFIGSGNEEQTVDITGIGPFSLSFDGETTATIPGDSTDTAVQAALEALPNIGSGDVEVKGSRNGPYTIEFTGSLGSQDVPLMSAEGLSNKIQRLAVDGESFASYDLTYGASTTPSIRAGFPNPTPEIHLDTLPAVKAAGGGVTVTGGPGNVGATKPFYVIFDGGTFAGTDQSISGAPEGFGAVNSVTVTDVQAAGQPLQGNVVTSKEPGHRTFTPEPADCPDAARLASAEIETPLLDHVMKGSVYLAEPFKNPFDELIGLYITANDVQTGIVIKLAGHVELDPVTGRVTAVFDDNPQLPFEHLRLHFFGGSTAALRTPSVCGDHTTTSVLTPWSAPDSGPPAQTTDTWQITQNCAGSEASKPNSPSFDAGTVSPIAGAHSAFVVHLRREDGSQNFQALNVSPPPGLLGKLAGTTSCSDAALAAAEAKTGAAEKASPSCPASSELGNVMAGAGAGPAPYFVPGKAYRTGPYKGAPLSITIIVPAVAGVFDLGTVVVKTALYVDSKTGRLSAVSDPIHTIIDGIPLGVRTIDITVDRPGFIVNPTSCDPMAVDGQLITTIGQVAPLSSRFQLGECTGLGFKPQLSLNLKGGTTRGKYPALTAVLTPRAGDANIASVSVALPKSEFLEQAHIGTVCTRVQFAADECPAASVYGTATVTTPLLDEPLTGNVYLRSSDNVLPDLVPDLRGPANLPLKIESAGRTDSVNRGIRNTFDYLPDAPFTKLVLQLEGGSKGLLQNSRNICSQVYRATVKYTAHNGKTFTAKPPLKNPKCGKAKKRKAAKRAKRRARSAAR